MDELVAWLRARLDEDEQVAKESARPDVYWYLDGHSPEAYAHITRWDPTRVLTEVEAKRRRLLRLEIALAEDPTNAEVGDLLKIDALPYAGREGYRPEWKP